METLEHTVESTNSYINEKCKGRKQKKQEIMMFLEHPSSQIVERLWIIDIPNEMYVQVS